MNIKAIEWNWTPPEYISCHGLLYVDASHPATDPHDDDLTRGMQALLDEAKQNTGTFEKRLCIFYKGRATMGGHKCCCGAASTNVDYLVAPGVVTNSLCVHYLQCHRDEIRSSDMDLVRELIAERRQKRPRENEEAEDKVEKKVKTSAVTYMVSRTRLAELLARDGKVGDFSSLSALSAHMSPNVPNPEFPELFLAIVQENGNDFWIEYRNREKNHTFCQMESYDPGFYFVLALIRAIGSEQ